ncbi:MAG: hypothetical protein ACK4N5_09050 [Myxococcales bacterium]
MATPTAGSPTDITETLLDVQRAMQRLLGAGLTRRALVTLLVDQTGGKVSRRDIELVLDAAANLASTCLTAETRKERGHG